MNDIITSNCISSSSKLKYESGAKTFLDYCESRKISPVPTQTTFSHFVSEISREIQPSSVNAYLTGIVHHFISAHPSAQAARMSAKVRNTVKGCSRVFSKARTRANAMTPEDLEILEIFTKKSFDDLLFNTILVLGFHGLHRLGELVKPDLAALHDDRKTINHCSLPINAEGGYVLYALPHIKTNHGFLGIPVVIPARPGSKICPLKTLVWYTAIRDNTFSTNPFWLLRSNGYLPSCSLLAF